jgi:acyl carrier protein
MEIAEIKTRLRSYIVNELMRNPEYPLGDDEPLLTGGLIDSFAIAQIGVFAENQFDTYIPDNDLVVEKIDTLNLLAATVAAARDKRRT